MLIGIVQYSHTDGESHCRGGHRDTGLLLPELWRFVTLRHQEPDDQEIQNGGNDNIKDNDNE